MSTIEHYPAKKMASKHLCLPLYPNETSANLKKRSTIIHDSLKLFDSLSKAFTEEILIDSAAQVVLSLEKCLQPNESFKPDFCRDYPSIIKVDLSLVEPHLDYSKFIAAALFSIDDSEQFSLAHYECRSDDSFSSIMAKLLPQLGFEDEFSESTAGCIANRIQKLVLSLRYSHRIRGSVLETLLEYFKQFSGVAVVIDSATAYERLSARYKYVCQFVHLELANSSELLFQKFIVYLIDKGYKRCILTPEVLEFLSLQCSAAQLPLPYIQQIVKFCVYRTLGSSIYLCQVPDEILSARLPADEADQIMSTLVRLTDGLPKLALNNVVISTMLRCISEDLKTPFELVKETLIPGFGTKAFLDRYYDKLKKLTPDQLVQILLRIKSLFDKGQAQPALDLLALAGPNTDGIRSQADVLLVVATLQEIVSKTEYLNTDHPLMSISMFYDVAELEFLFFADIGKFVQDSLKYPEQYMPAPKSNGRVGRNRPKKSAPLNIPDSARLYKLTLEWQRMINLHDIYFQFQSQIHAGPQKPTAEQQKGYMARFMQSINELELVGVWSSHGRKRDTYERRNFTDAPDEDLNDA